MTHGSDPAATSPLERSLKTRIELEGPIRVSDYMRACLHDPAHGYYRTRAAIGRAGDFITAPEISQVFGELVGLWAAVVWQEMGAPPRLRLIELGPGRGTMMRDALRAGRRVAGFRAAVDVELIESNSALAAQQRATLNGESVRWSARLAAPAAPTPTIVLANEFLDTLPVEQYVHRHGRWLERRVGLDAAGRLAFVAGPPREPSAPPVNVPSPASEGAVLESRAEALAGFADEIAALGAPLAMLIIDYGHAVPGFGDTLQAVRAHRHEDPLATPGEADLSAHVDFAGVAAAMAHRGFACDGPVTQAEFLGRHGGAERASRLMGANPDRAHRIEVDIARLMAPAGMGGRFLVLGVRSASLPHLPGLAAMDTANRAP